MSEEEIIKIIESMLLHAGNQLLDYEALALQDLLELYNKEKEETKKYKNALTERIKYCNELEKDLFENCNKYVVSKEKLKKILKHYENTPADNPDTTMAFYSDIKKLLEE